jgi:hypothetical protein
VGGFDVEKMQRLEVVDLRLDARLADATLFSPAKYGDQLNFVLDKIGPVSHVLRSN